MTPVERRLVRLAADAGLTVDEMLGLSMMRYAIRRAQMRSAVRNWCESTIRKAVGR